MNVVLGIFEDPFFYLYIINAIAATVIIFHHWLESRKLEEYLGGLYWQKNFIRQSLLRAKECIQKVDLSDAEAYLDDVLRGLKDERENPFA